MKTEISQGPNSSVRSGPVFGEVVTIARLTYARDVCVGPKGTVYLVARDCCSILEVANSGETLRRVALSGHELPTEDVCIVWFRDGLLLSHSTLHCVFFVNVTSGYVEIFAGCPGQCGCRDGEGNLSF